jgi:TolB-like protein
MAMPPKPVTESRAEVPSAVAGLIARCLEKDPAARPQSAQELLNVLGAVTTVEQVPVRLRRRPAALAATIAGAALVAAAAWYSLRPSGPVTVSVMLLGSIGGDSTQAALAEGFSDDIATELGKVPWVRVVSRSGVRNYRGQAQVDPLATGRALGAQYLVMGSLRDLDARRTVTVQLISSEDGSQLWSDLFDRSTDLAEIRNRVVRTIGDTLRPMAGRKFRAQVSIAPPVHHSTNEAYYLYLQGKEKPNRRGQDVGASITLFREAIALDSLSAKPGQG